MSHYDDSNYIDQPFEDLDGSQEDFEFLERPDTHANSQDNPYDSYDATTPTNAAPQRANYAQRTNAQTGYVRTRPGSHRLRPKSKPVRATTTTHGASYHSPQSQPPQPTEDDTFGADFIDLPTETTFDMPDINAPSNRRTLRPQPKPRNYPNTSSPHHSNAANANAAAVTHQQTQPQTQPFSMPGNFGNIGTAMGMAAAAAAASSNIGGVVSASEMVEMQRIFNNLPSYGILSLEYYKYYFRVDNTYVINKLKRLFLPFLQMKQKHWRRRFVGSSSSKPNGAAQQPSNRIGSGGGGIGPVSSLSPDRIAANNRSSDSGSVTPLNSPYEAPTNDINAPDGYLPLMAVVTYIVIMGFVVGLQKSEKFSPQILVGTASSACGLLTFEVLLMKSGFWLIGNVAQPPFWLDLVCFAGYKLVFVAVNLGICLINDSLIVYYLFSIGTGVLAALFMIQTLRPYFRDSIHSNDGIYTNAELAQLSPSSTEKGRKSKQIFLGVVGLAQIIFIQLMGRYAA